MAIEILFLLLMFFALFAGILSGMPAMIAISGAPLLVAGLGIVTGYFDPSFLHAFPQRVLGMMGNQLFIALPLFIFMGIMMDKAGLARSMLEGATRLAGTSRNSLGLSVLAISTLIAATTGVVGATIVMLGAISYPALVRSGISQRLASGLVVSAGTLGQIIPPSIVLIILADQISNAHQEAQRAGGTFAIEPVTVSDLFAGAMIPGLLLVILYSIYFVVSAKSERAREAGSEALPQNAEAAQDSVSIAKASVVVLLMPLFLILAVLGSIVFGIATPTEAAAVGAVGTLLLSGIKISDPAKSRLTYQLSWLGLGTMILLPVAKLLMDFTNGSMPIIFVPLALVAIVSAGIIVGAAELWRAGILKNVSGEVIHLSGMIFGIILAASVLSLVFRGFGGDQFFAELAGSLPGEKWGALLLVMIIVFLLGFVLEFIEIIFITVPIVGPLLLGMGFDPVWLAVLFALNLQTSFLTPPFGVALFYFRSVAPASLRTETLYKAIIPFVGLQLLALVLVACFPKLVSWLPAYLFG
ncbi:MAG: TRAP transporter large permease subunit [Salaquimonas sp.]